MPDNLLTLVTASTLPLLRYVFSSPSIWDFRRLLSIRNCSELHRLLKLHLNYTKSLESSGSEIIITPLIGIAPYIAFLEQSRVLPSTILALARRIGRSNPLNFKLFLEDVELCMDSLKRSTRDLDFNELISDIVFVYGPTTLSELMMNFIPLVIAIDLNRLASKIFQVNRTSVFNIEFENFPVLRRGNEYGILIFDREFEDTLNFNNNTATDVDLITDSIDDYHLHRTCSPLTCITNFNSITTIYEFRRVEDLVRYLLNREGKSTHLYIEFWSSYTHLMEQEKGYKYLWMPRIDGSSIREFLKSISVNSDLLTFLDRIILISPLKLFTELGSIANYRVWLSLLVEQILYRNSRIEVKLIT